MLTTPRFVAAVLCPLLVALSGTAAAEETDYRALANVEGATEEARIHFQLATRFYQTGRFSSAADEFRISYDLSGRIELLYNAFLAHREAMELDEAVEAAEAFIAGTEDDAHRQNAEARLERVRALQAQIAESPEDNPAEPVEEPAESVEPNEPGPVADARNVVHQPTAESGGSIAPWIVAGAGGAIALASIVPGILALGDNSELDDLCANGPCTGDAAAIQERGQRRANIADAMLFGGLAIAAGGVIWALVAGPSDDEEVVVVQAGGTCGPSGCSANISGAF